MEDEVETGETTIRTVPDDIPFENMVMDICMHPTMDCLAAGDIEGEVTIWSYSTQDKNHKMMTFNHHKKACRAIQFSEDGQHLYTASRDKSLKIRDVTTGGTTRKIIKAHSSPIFSMSVIDQFYAATGDDDGTVKLWDTRICKAVMDLKETNEYVSSLKMTKDNRTLVATSGEGVLLTFNIRARKLDTLSEDFQSELLCSEIVKDGDKIIVGSGEGTLKIFNNGEWFNVSDSFPGHPSSVDTMTKITENIVCTGSDDGIIRAISILPNRFIGIVGEHLHFPVLDLSLDRDGKLLASCSHDNTIKFWDVDFLKSQVVSTKKKAKTTEKKQHLKSSRNADFFADLLS